MAEYWDVYDKNRNKTGKIVLRGNAMEENEYHLVINGWVKNKDGKFLITQRVKEKRNPLMWECTGGSVLKDEDSLTGVIREIGEETGLNVENVKMKLVGTVNRQRSFYKDILDVWLFEYDGKDEDVKIQVEEVNDYKWATKEEIEELIKEGKFLKNAFCEEIINDRV